MNILEDEPSVYAAISKDRVITKGPNKGKVHIKVMVTFQVKTLEGKKWAQRPYKSGVFCYPDDFKKMISSEQVGKLPTLLQLVRKDIDIKLAAARTLLKTHSNEESFNSAWYSDKPVTAISTEFELKISELKKRAKISSAEKYQTALTSLCQFFKEVKGIDIVTFDMLTPENLQEYEDWYVLQPRKKDSHEKKSLTSVGINMRHTRHIVIRAIKKGLASENPFGDGEGKYMIPEGGDDTKRFLEGDDRRGFVNWRHSNTDKTKGEIMSAYKIQFRTRAITEHPDFRQWPDDKKTELFLNYTDELIEKRNRLHDYALFSYLGFGMNMSDLARLRKTRVFKTYLTIDRQKTKGKKKKQKTTTIPLHPLMRDIITRSGKRSLVPDDYVFPILDLSMNEQDIFYRIRDLVDDVNDVLALINKELNFELKPTSYTLRHTFAYKFMEDGATTEELQDALAHGLKQTTEHYKHGFGLERKKKFSDGLTN